jgi:hypothetical protein
MTDQGRGAARRPSFFHGEKHSASLRSSRAADRLHAVPHGPGKPRQSRYGMHVPRGTRAYGGSFASRNVGVPRMDCVRPASGSPASSRGRIAARTDGPSARAVPAGVESGRGRAPHGARAVLRFCRRTWSGSRVRGVSIWRFCSASVPPVRADDTRGRREPCAQGGVAPSAARHCKCLYCNMLGAVCAAAANGRAFASQCWHRFCMHAGAKFVPRGGGRSRSPY